MTTTRGWWRLDTGDFPVEDSDLDHIAGLIKEGYTQGELVHDEDEEEN